MPMPAPAQEADDDFTFPTPPPLLAAAACSYGHHRHSNRVSPSPSPSSSPLPAWLLSSPIRRSFSAADCAASPWRAARGRCCSPALSDYAAGFCDGGDEEEEMMDSLWEDLNDDEAPGGERNDLLIASLDVSRRRSIGGPGHPVDGRRPTTKAKEREAAAVLAASRSSRRRSPGLVVMMRTLKKIFVAHKSRSKVHKVDEQSTASASSRNSFKK